MSIIGGETNTLLQGQGRRMEFVVMDAPRTDGNGRELFAFVGGIDLTKGRWDNCKVNPILRA